MTLTGAGGVGKTRLALRASSEIGRAFPDGVWLVPLAPLDNPALLTRAVFDALGLQDRGSGWPLSALADYLAPKRILLVLDNCEHLLDGCAVLTSTLLQACPELRVLATSRQILGIAGEERLRVPSLSLPSDGGEVSVERALDSEAVALLVERALAVMPTFKVDASNAAEVLRLCRKLDGIPLALELAAVRLEALSLSQVNQTLDRELSILGEGNRGAAPRQQTLEATIDWSYRLLTEAEQLLWARLSVFAGGFDLEAAIQVCSDPGLPAAGIVELLARLVEKSILLRAAPAEPARYGLLETLRQFGRRKLRDLGAEEDLQRRHRNWILDLARVAGAFDDRQTSMFRRISLERDNLWSALTFCVRQPGEALAGVEIFIHLYPYWYSHGPTNELRRLLESLTELTAVDSVARADCLSITALLALGRNEIGAWEMAEESLLAAKQTHDDDAVARSLGCLIFTFAVNKRWDDGTKASESMLEIGQAMGARWVVTWALYGLASFRLLRGAIDQVIEPAEEAASLSREAGESWIRGQALVVLMQAWWRLGKLDRADAAAREAAHCLHAIDDRRSLVALFESMASMATERGTGERVATLLGCSNLLLDSMASSLLEFQRPRRQASEDFARGSLGEKAFVAALARGRAMTIDEGVAYAIDEKKPTQPELTRQPKLSLELTRRERDVAELVAQGLSNKQIAAKLVVSQRTAESHILNILNKLGFNSRTQIATWATNSQLANSGKT